MRDRIWGLSPSGVPAQGISGEAPLALRLKLKASFIFRIVNQRV